MKNSIKYIIIVIITLFTSCEKFLESPQKSILVGSGFWTSESSAELAMAGIYDAAQTVLAPDYWRWGELRADNYVNNDRPGGNFYAIVQNALVPTTAGSNWSGLYTAIANTNFAIKNLQAMPDFPRKNIFLAEALTWRAFFYFYGVRVWGDLPKVTQPVEGLDQDLNVSRSPSSEIYNEIIIPDLEEAEDLMTTVRSLNTISLSAILALKAHVYMWPGDHQNYGIARDAITRIEGFGYHRLETTQQGWIDIFKGNQDSREIIFSLAWNFLEDGGNSGVGQFSTATPEYLPSEDLEQKWQAAIPGDFRILASASFDIEIVPGQEMPYLRILTKYSPRFDDRNIQGTWASTNDRDIIIFRLSELLLLKAEAENYLNNPAAALALINRIRTARGLILVDETITDKIVIRDLILDERQFELMGEGHRYWDLVRNDVVLEVMGPINGMNDPRRILWPVNLNVMNRNPNIIQNDGY
jgi:starch-binding outer membrane protein, SusD/RagB family